MERNVSFLGIIDIVGWFFMFSLKKKGENTASDAKKLNLML